MKIFVGWDPRDDLAAKVCISSLKKHASKPIEVVLLRDYELRKRGLYNRPYRVLENGQMVDERDFRPFSTQFAFTRFLVPYLADERDDLVLFVDADFLFRADVAELFALASEAPLSCVHHVYAPEEGTKMDGVLQKTYYRKNWSSLMLMRPVELRRHIKLQDVNREDGRWLHGLVWLQDHQIGSIPEEWNWLEGWSRSAYPRAVHFTRGTPDMIGDHIPYAKEWREYADAA